MSEKVVEGVCLFQKKIQEKDIEATMFSKEEGVTYVKVVSSLKGVGLNIPLCSTSKLFLATRNIEKYYILKDIQIIKARENIVLDYELFSVFSMLSNVLMALGNYDIKNSYYLFEEAINLIDNHINPYLVMAHTIERFFVLQGVQGDYNTCPYCERMYGDDEIIGYSYEHNCSCCNNCASVLNVLTSTLRKYLNATQRLTLNQVVLYPYDGINIKRLLSFECFRLKKLLGNKSEEINEFLRRVVQ